MLYISFKNEHISSKFTPDAYGILTTWKLRDLERSRSKSWKSHNEPEVIQTSGWLQRFLIEWRFTFLRYVTSKKIYDFFTSKIVNFQPIPWQRKIPIIKYRELFHISMCYISAINEDIASTFKPVTQGNKWWILKNQMTLKCQDHKIKYQGKTSWSKVKGKGQRSRSRIFCYCNNILS